MQILGSHRHLAKRNSGHSTQWSGSSSGLCRGLTWKAPEETPRCTGRRVCPQEPQVGRARQASGHLLCSTGAFPTTTTVGCPPQRLNVSHTVPSRWGLTSILHCKEDGMSTSKSFCSLGLSFPIWERKRLDPLSGTELSISHTCWASTPKPHPQPFLRQGLVKLLRLASNLSLLSQPPE